MKKFQPLTKYLPLISADGCGLWVIDHENDGTIEHPIQLPFVNYSAIVRNFEKDLRAFNDNNKEYNLNHYGEILEKNGIEWRKESMSAADVSDKDAQCVLALLIGAVRAERFCDGALLGFFENGSVEKWLKRLLEIDGGDIKKEVYTTLYHDLANYLSKHPELLKD